MSSRRGPRLAGGVALLVGVWIAVYWSWEPRGDRVSMHQPESVAASDDRPLLDRASDAVVRADTAADPTPSGPPEIDLDGVLELVQGRSSPAGIAAAENASPPTSRVDKGFDYIVQRGDTFESIAAEHLGDEQLWTVLARANPFVSPDRITPGAVLRVPARGAIEREPSMPPAVPRDAEYVVASGDTLSAISQRVYGTSRYTDALFQANRDRLRSPDALRVGQALVIPPIESLGGGGPR